MNLREQHLKIAMETRGNPDPPVDLPLLLMCYLGIEMADRVNEGIMEMRKEFEFEDYKFVIGIYNAINYTVGLLSMPHLKNFHPEELRKYRYAMFQVQNEITKMQGDVDRVLQASALG